MSVISKRVIPQLLPRFRREIGRRYSCYGTVLLALFCWAAAPKVTIAKNSPRGLQQWKQKDQLLLSEETSLLCSTRFSGLNLFNGSEIYAIRFCNKNM